MEDPHPQTSPTPPTSSSPQNNNTPTPSTPNENNNEAKKVKLTTNGHENMETATELEYYENGEVNGSTENGTVANVSASVTPVTTKPSKVVHIRNIPSDVSETEIVHLGIPFGRVSNVLVLKVKLTNMLVMIYQSRRGLKQLFLQGKNQAFLELADESAAIAMVSYFTNCVAQLRGRSVYVQYSTHKELKTDQSHSNANSAAQVRCLHSHLYPDLTSFNKPPNPLNPNRPPSKQPKPS